MYNNIKNSFKKNSKSFYFASLFLNRKTSYYCYVLYTFCRKVDDIADKKTNEKKKKLNELIFLLNSKTKPKKIFLIEIKKLIKKKILNKEPLIELIQGVLTDTKHVHIQNTTQLINYSYLVAGSVGIMMCKLLNNMNHYSYKYAVDLGIAMQLTNILRDIIEDAKHYMSFEKDENELQKILDDHNSDEELKKMAEIELNELKEKYKKNEKKLKLFLLPKDEADKKNAIIEIRAGTGGLEASLFAADLFKMYEKVSHRKKWILELISISRSEAGGLKEVIASIKGTNIYSTLKYESGVHRVQRVPDTETQGRVHTSAATVAVLPEAEEVDLKINEADLRIDVFRAGGPGGQSVNTTDSAVRITHIPTGLSVSQQDEKSQHKNKAKGMKILRSRLYELERSRIDQERSKDRKSKIGSGDRSERIRTYNFPQGRVTDHRINLTLHKLEEFLEGNIFDEMIESLTLQAQEETLNKL